MTSIKNKQIFVIDDDPIWAFTLTFFLNELGYNDVKTFESGAQCIQNLDAEPGLIFLDYEMEEMDGLQVLQQIKSLTQEVDIVFATSKEDLEVAMNAIKLGSFDYLLKQNTSIDDLDNVLKMLAIQNNTVV